MTDIKKQRIFLVDQQVKEFLNDVLDDLYQDRNLIPESPHEVLPSKFFDFIHGYIRACTIERLYDDKISVLDRERESYKATSNEDFNSQIRDHILTRLIPDALERLRLKLIEKEVSALTPEDSVEVEVLVKRETQHETTEEFGVKVALHEAASAAGFSASAALGPFKDFDEGQVEYLRGPRANLEKLRQEFIKRVGPDKGTVGHDKISFTPQPSSSVSQLLPL